MSGGTSIGVRLRNQLLAIGARETTFQRRRFESGAPRTRAHLENVGAHFLIGYHMALHNPRQVDVKSLDNIVPLFRGFAYEGAAMALAVHDGLTFNGRRFWEVFSASHGDDHIYMMHVGAGWAMARIPWLRWRMTWYLSHFDDLLRWLLVDGYGFHQGYFHPQRYLYAMRHDRAIGARGYQARAFDQGLGRSLWFVTCANPRRISAIIGNMAQERHADLWSGVGLAATYAGGVSAEILDELREIAGTQAIHLAQGAVFAAAARHRAGNVVPYTFDACRLLTGLSVEDASDVAEQARLGLPQSLESHQPAYEGWRGAIRQRLAMRRPVAELSNEIGFTE
ncbi:MAG: DUF1702 family protein [Pirellulaceae bacterium]|nr:DUF1702 family protein [Planctomycetales bacterium]